jgi:hypothetical protein
MNTPKNKIKTPGYFMKRLRDNGFIVLKVFNAYGTHDPRRWTVLVDPGGSSVFITCFTNKDFMNDVMFELNDGGLLFNRNYSIKTDSIEVIIKYLLERGVNNDPRKSPFYTERPKYNREEPQKI